MVRLGDEFNSAMDEKSLFKGGKFGSVKQDPEARIQMKRESMGLIVDKK